MLTSQSPLIEKQIQLGEHHVTYLDAGISSDASPIVFLHGWGIAADPYHEILGQLAQRHRVIAPDLPGFAGSREYGVVESYERYAQVLLSFLDALGIESAHLIGHSLGGGIAIVMAAHQPQRVKSLILVDSTGTPSVSLLEIPFRRALEMTLQISPSKLYLQFLEIPRVFTPNLLFNLPNVLQGLFLSLVVRLEPLLHQIESPCLLVWSAKDLTTPRESAEALHQHIQGSQLMMVEEGFHEWALWNPEKFVSIVLNFIETTIAKKQVTTPISNNGSEDQYRR